jgi:hypothetical protein
MGGFSSGWLYNLAESAINGWDVSRRNGLPTRDKWLIVFSFRTGVGCVIKGWDIFRGGRFQTRDFDNQSLQPMVDLRSGWR